MRHYFPEMGFRQVLDKPANGSSRQTARRYAVGMSQSRKVLAKNLNALMAYAEGQGRLDLATPFALEDATKGAVGKSTIYRIANEEVDARINHVEQLAKAFKMEAWMLLAPALKPDTDLIALSTVDLEDRVSRRAEELVQATLKQLTAAQNVRDTGPRPDRSSPDRALPAQGTTDPSDEPTD